MCNQKTTQPFTLTLHTLYTKILYQIQEKLEKKGIECGVYGDYLTNGQEISELYCKDGFAVEEAIKKDREIARLIKLAERLTH